MCEEEKEELVGSASEERGERAISIDGFDRFPSSLIPNTFGDLGIRTGFFNFDSKYLEPG